MIQLSANITYTGLTPDLTVKEWNNVKRFAYQELGEEFWRTNLPRRFTVSGGRMLGYAPRSPKYDKAKRKKHGHADPLVATGVSRDLATKIMDVRTVSTQTSTRAKIVLRARALNFRNPASEARGVNPSDEVRRIADKEVQPLVDKLARFIQEGFKNVPFNPKRDQLF